MLLGMLQRTRRPNHGLFSVVERGALAYHRAKSKQAVNSAAHAASRVDSSVAQFHCTPTNSDRQLLDRTKSLFVGICCICVDSLMPSEHARHLLTRNTPWRLKGNSNCVVSSQTLRTVRRDVHVVVPSTGHHATQTSNGIHQTITGTSVDQTSSFVLRSTFVFGPWTMVTPTLDVTGGI